MLPLSVESLDASLAACGRCRYTVDSDMSSVSETSSSRCGTECRQGCRSLSVLKPYDGLAVGH
eukprot:6233504-Prymnesium_polylepis.1